MMLTEECEILLRGRSHMTSSNFGHFLPPPPQGSTGDEIWPGPGPGPGPS